MYDDDRVTTLKFTKTQKKHTMEKRNYMKTAPILFYVSPSIETHIKNAKTIDLMEGGKEHAQVVTTIQTNSDINPCDGDGKAITTPPADTTPTTENTKKKKKEKVKKTHEGNTALRKGKKRAGDVPVQTDSEGAKEMVGIYVDGEDTNISNRWLELYKERDGPDRPVFLPEIKKAKLRAMFPIIYCINNKDITDDNNWAPCILIKVRKDQYEVLDVNGDLKVDEDIEWEGDDGLSTTWTMYHKYPSTTFVDSFRTRLEMAAENDKKDDEEDKIRESGKVGSSSGEESLGSSDSLSTTDSSSDSSSTTNSSDSS
jgi:hypothetical protein